MRIRGEKKRGRGGETNHSVVLLGDDEGVLADESVLLGEEAGALAPDLDLHRGGELVDEPNGD